MSSRETLGVRLNNPGNIEWGAPWQGLVPREQSMYYRNGNHQQQRFCQFVDPAFGIRAIAVTLTTYYDKRIALDGSKIDTIYEMVERWAPSFENNVAAYANHVGRLMGISPRQVINFRDPAIMRGLVEGIIAHENAGYRYPSKVVEEGLRRAGYVPVEQIKQEGPQVPVNVETVAGAAAPIAIGVGSLAPILPDVAAAIGSQQENLSSGDWSRVAIGLVLVGIGGAVAWSQFNRRKAGSV